MNKFLKYIFYISLVALLSYQTQANLNDKLLAVFQFESDCTTDTLGNYDMVASTCAHSDEDSKTGSYSCKCDRANSTYISSNLYSVCGNGCTISMHWKRNSIGYYGGLMSGADSSDSDSRLYYLFYDNEKLEFYSSSTAGADTNSVLPATTYPDTTAWHHAIIYWNSDGHLLTDFVDGTNRSIDSTNDYTLTDWDELIFMATRYSGGLLYNDGYIDEIYIWNRSLTPSEIADMNNTFYPFPNPSSLTLSTNLENSSYFSTVNTTYFDSNSNFVFNFTGTIANTGDSNFNCTMYLNTTSNATMTNVNISLVNLFHINGTFENTAFDVNVTCLNNNASDSFFRGINLDNVPPDLNISTNFVNNSLNWTPNDLTTYEITATDTNLYAFNHTLLRDGVVIYNNQTVNINTTEYQFNFSELLSTGNYTIIASAWEDHNPITRPHEKTTHQEVLRGASSFYWGENVIQFISDDIDYFYISSEENHYRLEMDVKNKVDASIFLQSNKKIDYRANSQHKAHFVIFEMFKSVDFDSPDITIKSIEKVSDYKYKIKLNFEKNEVKTNSITDLPSITKEWYFEMRDSMSLFAVNLSTTDTTFDSASYVNVSVNLFNTSDEENLVILTSMNLEKATNPQTSLVEGRILLDGVILREQELRTVSVVGNVGVTGFFPTLAEISSSGEHTIQIQMRENGQGAVTLSNFNLILFQEETNKNTNTTDFSQDVELDFTDTNLGSIVNFTFNQSVTADVFYIFDATIETDNAGGSDNNFRFLDNDDLGISPYSSRSLSGTSDLGKFVLNYIDTDNGFADNMSLQAQTTTGTTTINGSIFGGNFQDDLKNRIFHMSGSNPNTNVTNTVTFNAGVSSLANFTHTLYNASNLFISAYVSLNSSSGTQTPTFFINSSGETCTEKERTLSADIGNIYMYAICDNFNVNETVLIQLMINVPTGETVEIIDENILGFEVVPFDITRINNPPTINILQDLPSTENEDTALTVIANAQDLDSPNINLTITWFVDALQVATETTATTSLTNVTFNLLPAFFNAGQLVNATLSATDGEDSATPVTTNQTNITALSSSELNTQLLRDINQSNFNQEGTLTDILEVIDLLWIVLLVFAFLLVGAIIKMYWMWGFSTVGMIVLGVTIFNRADTEYNLILSIVFYGCGIALGIAGVLIQTIESTRKSLKGE